MFFENANGRINKVTEVQNDFQRLRKGFDSAR